ncbi:MAG: TonB-dependent receptor [Chitinophaga sp.]|jgi:outer membrane receptor for ferrienterochelin and colicins|nr:TonB-dependent receptor [Chitinophaga sp.]
MLLIGFLCFHFTIAQSTEKNDSFFVAGVCEQCKARIQNAVKLKGVSNAVWNVDSKILNVTYNESVITLNKIKNKILAAGHDLEDKKAKDIIYKQLPNCCHYRELTVNDEKQQTVSDSTASITINNAETIKGVVVEEDAKGKFNPLQNASVYWLGSDKGVVTDNYGVFNIKPIQSNNKLIVSYTGYVSDTIDVADKNVFKIVLAAKKNFTEVTVSSKRRTSYVSSLETFRTQIMTGGELLKAACCNLSESFETNPSVDVSYNDAVTGSKQIQLLGLSGNYSQLTVENLPGPRGLATPLGLNSIAGPWIESIQLTKGVGSVANGYESIAGQINVELKKPESSEKLLANAYVNDFGKTDLNLNVSKRLNKNWSTALLLHDDFSNNTSMDENKDGFRDMPTGNLFSLVNRYKYDNSKGLLAQVGVKAMIDDKIAGQTAFNPSKDKGTTNAYGVGIKTERYELFGKLGYVFPQQRYKSVGLQLAAINHQQNAYFGLTDYNAKQKSFYTNFIYQSIINTTEHKFRTGISFSYDDYNEIFKNQLYTRTEIVPGAFFEYTFTPSDKFSAVAGLRVDNNNLFGSFVTPRLNIRYEPFKGTVIRMSAGRGQRTANIFAENTSVFVSARQVNIINPQAGKAYGLNPEVAWNKGITVDQKFKLFSRDATVSIDYFRNDFTNQVVTDLEYARAIRFYNLNGPSYSNSYQIELNAEPLKKFEVRLAYRYFDVKTTYNNVLLEKPLLAPHRAFLSLDYATTNAWKFNYTVTYNGVKRLPNTSANTTQFQLANYSQDYVLMNVQVSKSFGKKYPMDVYVGAENITGFTQPNAIVAANQPFGQYFDASMIWGPITGRMLYVGWRLKLK